MATFTKAVKTQAKARIGLIGPSGSGKTYSALLLAKGLGSKVAVIDSEHGSASKYADEFDFDTLALETYHPQHYIDGISSAGQAGYDVLIIDSLSHAWAGTDGALELADKNATKYGGNRFAAWRDVTPLHNKLIEAILSSPCHVIATMRSKMEYIQTQDDKGKTVIKKVGMQPIQRDGMEYEFDIVGDLDLEHNLVISKTRCRHLDGAVINKPGEQLAATVKAWLTDGVEAPPKPAPATNGANGDTSGESKDLRKAIGDMIMEMCEGDKNLAGDILEKHTAYTKDGKDYPGKRSLRDVSDKALPPTYGRVKEAYKAWQTNTGRLIA